MLNPYDGLNVCLKRKHREQSQGGEPKVNAGLSAGRVGSRTHAKSRPEKQEKMFLSDSVDVCHISPLSATFFHNVIRASRSQRDKASRGTERETFSHPHTVRRKGYNYTKNCKGKALPVNTQEGM